jgi:catalase
LIAVLGCVKVTLPAFCERKTQMTKPQTKMKQADSLTRDALQALDDLSGLHPGFRPVHAKGILLSGVFTSSTGVDALTKAPHVSRPSIRVAVRFSDFAGVPTVPDYDSEGASPRGIAIRFYLQDNVHTDIIAHSVEGFPTRTAEEFMQFLRARTLNARQLVEEVAGGTKYDDGEEVKVTDAA